MIYSCIWINFFSAIKKQCNHIWCIFNLYLIFVGSWGLIFKKKSMLGALASLNDAILTNFDRAIFNTILISTIADMCYQSFHAVMGRWYCINLSGCSTDSSPLLLSVSPIVKLSRLNKLFLILILVMILFYFLVHFLSFYVKVLLSRLDFWEAFNYIDCPWS